MPNLMRNDLIIEGNNVPQVLDAIGFKSTVPLIGEVLIDFGRIMPQPQDIVGEAVSAWRCDNWGSLGLYDGARSGDIFELTGNKARFKFYTAFWQPHGGSAVPAIETLAKRFPAFKFHLRAWEQQEHVVGDVAWENGQRTLCVPLFPLKLDRRGLPANEPITAEIKTAAAQMVKAAVENYRGAPPSQTRIRDAESILADVIAESGSHVLVNAETLALVEVEFEPTGNGMPCLFIEVDPLSDALRAAWDLEEAVKWKAELTETEHLRGTLGLDFLVPDQSRAVRFALLPFTAAAMNDPYRVIAPVIRYLNVDPVSGKYDVKNNPAIEWEIRHVCLTRFDVSQIKGLPDEEQTPYDIDIVMTHSEGHAFGYEFSRISTKARWKQDPELAEQVEKAAVEASDALAAKLAGKAGVAIFDDLQSADPEHRKAMELAVFLNGNPGSV
ncbi:MAG TPA: hypothetical protein VMU02_10265 [bacterium]|nr:hypothetical protein [bacterium]